MTTDPRINGPNLTMTAYDKDNDVPLEIAMF